MNACGAWGYLGIAGPCVTVKAFYQLAIAYARIACRMRSLSGPAPPDNCRSIHRGTLIVAAHVVTIEAFNEGIARWLYYTAQVAGQGLTIPRMGGTAPMQRSVAFLTPIRKAFIETENGLEVDNLACRCSVATVIFANGPGAAAFARLPYQSAV